MVRNAKYAGLVNGVLLTGTLGGWALFVSGARATGGGINPTTDNQG